MEVDPKTMVILGIVVCMVVGYIIIRSIEGLIKWIRKPSKKKLNAPQSLSQPEITSFVQRAVIPQQITDQQQVERSPVVTMGGLNKKRWVKDADGYLRLIK